MEPRKVQQNERRTKFRFEMPRDLRYKVVEDETITAFGTGQTIDMGSGGVAFVAEQELKPGAFVEISISWPVLLDKTLPMRLIVFGRVLRSVGCKTVCSIHRYEFRTQAQNAQAPTAQRSDGMLQRWAEGFRKGALKTSQAGA
jgi:PilZ domain